MGSWKIRSSRLQSDCCIHDVSLKGRPRSPAHSAFSPRCSVLQCVSEAKTSAGIAEHEMRGWRRGLNQNLGCSQPWRSERRLSIFGVRYADFSLRRTTECSAIEPDATELDGTEVVVVAGNGCSKCPACVAVVDVAHAAVAVSFAEDPRSWGPHSGPSFAWRLERPESCSGFLP